MRFSTVLARSVAFLQTVAALPAVSNYLESSSAAPCNISSAQVQRDLGSALSRSTTIFSSDDPSFDNATRRWSTFAVPQVQVVIEPGEESDISKIVKYCNKKNIDFLVYNRGHGTPKSLASFNGIQINIGNLDKVTVQPGSKSVWVQGGTHAGPVNEYLWDKGYVTTTGSCSCVGLAGAGLGGGHGRLEGLHGLISDNIRQLNVVLADGSSLRVNAISHSDLFWALRGAGHNFAIVTSMELNIFPRGPLTWHYKNYIWRGDQLDTIFAALNDLHGNGTTPVSMAANFGSFIMIPDVSKTEPVISWQFAYRGSAEEAAPYLAPFDAIEAVSTDTGDVPYPKIAHAQAVGEEDAACTASTVRVLTTAGLETYNITAEHQIWDSFTKRIAENPDLVRMAIIIHEGYSTKAVKDRDRASTAYPFRGDHHLMQFQGNLPPDSGLEEQMLQWATEVQDLWNAGQPNRLPDAYVNYASGFESVQNWYGHEPWRVTKLRGLKAKYDPFNRFRFYNPIV